MKGIGPRATVEGPSWLRGSLDEGRGEQQAGLSDQLGPHPHRGADGQDHLRESGARLGNGGRYRRAVEAGQGTADPLRSQGAGRLLLDGVDPHPVDRGEGEGAGGLLLEVELGGKEGRLLSYGGQTGSSSTVVGVMFGSTSNATKPSGPGGKAGFVTNALVFRTVAVVSTPIPGGQVPETVPSGLSLSKKNLSPPGKAILPPPATT